MVAGHVRQHIDQMVHDRDHGKAQAQCICCSPLWSIHSVGFVEGMGMYLQMMNWSAHWSRMTWGFQQQVRSEIPLPPSSEVAACAKSVVVERNQNNPLEIVEVVPLDQYCPLVGHFRQLLIAIVENHPRCSV